jgi:hypothetical protein
MPWTGDGNQRSDVASVQVEGKTYSELGYKRMILDYHYSEFNPDTLKNSNAGAIVEAMKDLGVNSMLLYAKDHWGNCYFATQKFHRHRAVPTDLFGDVLAGLKRNDIKVIAYYSVAWDEYAGRLHPEWLARDQNGHPYQLEYYRVIPFYARWSTLCLNSPYRDYSLGELEEIVSQYDFQALFLDIFGLFPLCYCPYCEALWKERYGESIPRGELSPTQTARYLDFVEDVTFGRFYRQVHEILKAQGKQIPTTHNAGLNYSLDGYVATEIDPYGADYYRPGLEIKLLRARAGGKETEVIGHRTNGIFDFTLKPTLMLRWEVAMGVAHNCAMMFVDQGFDDGSLDKVAYAALHEGFQVADQLSPHMSGTLPYSEILIVSSERSEMLNRGKSTPLRLEGERVDLHGAYKVFADLHLPFDIASEKQLLTLDLKNYPLIVFPYSAFLPVELGERLRQYVEQGGTLFFTYRTGQWDESGKAAATPLFGPLKVGEDWDDQVAFMKPTTPLGDTYLRVAEVAQFECLQDAETLTTLTHPALRSSEIEWVTHNVIPGKDTSSPTMIRGKLGKGVFIYCGFRLFKEHIIQGLGVYRNLVERALEGVYQPRIQVQAPRVVEAIYNRIGPEIRITLVNGITNKPAGKDHLIDIDELIPISGISVMVRDEIAFVEDIKGRRLSFSSQSDGTRRIEIPRLEQFEVVTVHLSNKYGRSANRA